MEEGMAGLMQRLQLAEGGQSIIIWRALEGQKASLIQAIGKVFSEEATTAASLTQTLGKIWCQREGTTCKELHRNLFLFTFKQASGKRRALEEGPWLAGKDLLIVEDFVTSKSLDEYRFVAFPIWVGV